MSSLSWNTPPECILIIYNKSLQKKQPSLPHILLNPQKLLLVEIQYATHQLLKFYAEGIMKGVTGDKKGTKLLFFAT